VVPHPTRDNTAAFRTPINFFGALFTQMVPARSERDGLSHRQKTNWALEERDQGTLSR
jgi:hypothetical protein